MKHIVIIAVLSIIGLGTANLHAQKSGVKTNLLYWATTTPNVGVEFATSQKTTISVTGGFNYFDFPSGKRKDGVRRNPKFHHWLAMPEFKYWFCKAFERGNIGVHAIYSEYNVGGIAFIKPLRKYRYKGNMWGGGISYGHQWAIGTRWGLEASVGVGYLHLDYKKYDCGECGDFIGKYTRNYIGPTKAAVSFIYFLK